MRVASEDRLARVDDEGVQPVAGRKDCCRETGDAVADNDDFGWAMCAPRSDVSVDDVYNALAVE